MPGESVRNELYQSYELPVNKLEIGPLLGHGAFGQVHLAVAKGLKGFGHPKEVAVKSLKGKPNENVSGLEL